MSRFALISLVGYLALLLAIVAALIWFRGWALGELSGAAAQSDWEQWREAVRKQNERAPVKRKVPASDEPPALKLMREYFAVSLAMSLALSSALYAVLVVAIWGVLKREGRA